MEQLSLDQLLASVPPQLLDQKITNDIHLAEIAKSLSRWKAAIAYLGLSEMDEEDIEEERGLDAQRRAVLRKWRAKYGPNATYRNLANCFYNGGKPDMVEAICKVLQPTSQPAQQYQPATQYQPAPQHPPAGGYYPPQSGAMYQQPPPPGQQYYTPKPQTGGYYPLQSGAMYQQPPPPGQQYYTPNPQSTTYQMSATMSSTQSPEYQRLQEKFDAVIRHLGAVLSAEDLADKLYVNKLITSGTQEEASLGAVTNTKKIRALVIAIRSKVEIDPANYHKFLTVLKAISGAEDIAKLLEL